MLKAYLTLGTLRVVEGIVEVVLNLQWSLETADSALTFGVFTLHRSFDHGVLLDLGVGESIVVDGPDITDQLVSDKLLVTRRDTPSGGSVYLCTIELTTVKIFSHSAGNVKTVIPVPVGGLRGGGGAPLEKLVYTNSWADGTECYHIAAYDPQDPSRHIVVDLQWLHSPFTASNLPGGFSGKCPLNCGALPSPANCGVEPME